MNIEAQLQLLNQKSNEIMTELNEIENIIKSPEFKVGKDYVTAFETNFENNKETKKRIYSILSEKLKEEISPFSMMGKGLSLKTDKRTKDGEYFCYEQGEDEGSCDKFTVIVGHELDEKRKKEAERQQREVEQWEREEREIDFSEPPLLEGRIDELTSDGDYVYSTYREIPRQSSRTNQEAKQIEGSQQHPFFPKSKGN